MRVVIPRLLPLSTLCWPQSCPDMSLRGAQSVPRQSSPRQGIISAACPAPGNRRPGFCASCASCGYSVWDAHKRHKVHRKNADPARAASTITVFCPSPGTRSLPSSAALRLRVRFVRRWRTHFSRQDAEHTAWQPDKPPAGLRSKSIPSESCPAPSFLASLAGFAREKRAGAEGAHARAPSTPRPAHFGVRHETPTAARAWVRRCLVWGAAALVGFAGHFGAMMVWGKDWFS